MTIEPALKLREVFLLNELHGHVMVFSGYYESHHKTHLKNYCSMLT